MFSDEELEKMTCKKCGYIDCSCDKVEIKEVKEELLYICDHADPSCKCMGKHYKLKRENDPMRYNGRCMNRGGIEVKSIPYTEEKEEEKACDTCSQSWGNSGLCVVDFNCKENDYLYHTSIKKVEKEPKTKRVAVIWFGEVPVDKCENPVICDEMTGYVYDQVELIDGDLVSEGFGGEVGGGSYKTYKVTYLPTPEPEPETVEDVLKRMPNPKDYQVPISGVINLRGYYNAMKSCFKDLKAAQEREE